MNNQLIFALGSWLALGLIFWGLSSLFGWGEPILFRIGRMRWKLREAFIPMLFTGVAGSGKSYALLQLIRCLLTDTTQKRKVGLLIFDGKESLIKDVVKMAESVGRSADVVLIEVRPDGAPKDWKPKTVLNLLNIKLPFSTSLNHLQAAAGGRSAHREEEPFFVQSSLTLLTLCCRGLEFIGFDVTWSNLASLVQKEKDLHSFIKTLGESQKVCITQTERKDQGAAEKLPQLTSVLRDLEGFMEMPPAQLGGITGSCRNWLSTFSNPDFAEVFSAANSTFKLQEELDEGSIVLLSIPGRYERERRTIQILLKLLFYTEVKNRLSLSPAAIEEKNIWGFIMDEAHKFMSVSEEGAGEVDYLDTCRSAKVVTAFATQGIASIESSIGPVHTPVVAQNLPTRVVFRAADERGSKEASQMSGTRESYRTETTTSSKGGRSKTRRIETVPRVRDGVFRVLKDHQAVIMKSSDGLKIKKCYVAPRTAEGKLPHWYLKKRFKNLLWPF